MKNAIKGVSTALSSEQLKRVSDLLATGSFTEKQ